MLKKSPFKISLLSISIMILCLFLGYIISEINHTCNELTTDNIYNLAQKSINDFNHTFGDFTISWATNYINEKPTRVKSLIELSRLKYDI